MNGSWVRPRPPQPDDFGRAVSRILSAPSRAERIICLSSQYPGPVPHGGTWSGPLRGPLFGLAPDGVFRASALALGAVGSYPTFSPLPWPRRRGRGGLFSVALSVGTPRGVTSRVYLAAGLLASAPASYAASRPLVFGLSSSPGSLRGKRFSALPKSRPIYLPPAQRQAATRGFGGFVCQPWEFPGYSATARSMSGV